MEEDSADSVSSLKDQYNNKKKKQFEKYVTKCKERLQNILALCNWNEDDVMKDFSTNNISSNANKERSVEPNDLPLPESFQSLNSVVIDKETLNSILHTSTKEIPRTFSDIQLNFTREEKLILYSHATAKTGRLYEPEPFVSFANETDTEANQMTLAQIVATKNREKKKRRYRVSKPTHIEEVRNLVELQMQALKQYFKPKNGSRGRSREKLYSSNSFGRAKDYRDDYRSRDAKRNYREIGSNSSRCEYREHKKITSCDRSRSYVNTSRYRSSRKRRRSKSREDSVTYTQNNDRFRSSRRSDSKEHSVVNYNKKRDRHQILNYKYEDKQSRCDTEWKKTHKKNKNRSRSKTINSIDPPKTKIEHSESRDNSLHMKYLKKTELQHPDLMCNNDNSVLIANIKKEKRSSSETSSSTDQERKKPYCSESRKYFKHKSKKIKYKSKKKHRKKSIENKR